jgi:hypothetical protein
VYADRFSVLAELPGVTTPIAPADIEVLFDCASAVDGGAAPGDGGVAVDLTPVGPPSSLSPDAAPPPRGCAQIEGPVARGAASALALLLPLMLLAHTARAQRTRPRS